MSGDTDEDGLIRSVAPGTSSPADEETVKRSALPRYADGSLITAVDVPMRAAPATVVEDAPDAVVAPLVTRIEPAPAPAAPRPQEPARSQAVAEPAMRPEADVPTIRRVSSADILAVTVPAAAVRERVVTGSPEDEAEPAAPATGADPEARPRRRLLPIALVGVAVAAAFALSFVVARALRTGPEKQVATPTAPVRLTTVSVSHPTVAAFRVTRLPAVTLAVVKPVSTPVQTPVRSAPVVSASPAPSQPAPTTPPKPVISAACGVNC